MVNISDYIAEADEGLLNEFLSRNGEQFWQNTMKYHQPNGCWT